MINERKKFLKLYEIAIFITAILSTMPIINIKGNTAFTWSLYLLIFILIIYNIPISFSKKDIYLYVVLLSIATTMFSLYSMIDIEWKIRGISSLINMILIFIIYLLSLSLGGKKYLKLFIKGIYISCWIQIIWCFLQVISFNIFEINLNEAIFNNIFHMSIEVSMMKNGVISYSGLCWNPANLAPIVVIGYLMSNKLTLKLPFIIVAIICGSSTAIIGIAMCMILEYKNYINYILSKRKFISYKKIFGIVIFCIILIFIIFIERDIISSIINKIVLFIDRIKNIQNEASGSTHLRYYTKFAYVFKECNLKQKLFGYGLSASGYPFSIMFGQYTNLSTWVVESDIINIILSRGILGFIVYYIWLANIMISGRKIDNRYFILILTFIIQGIAYNIQFNWIVFFEMFVMISIKTNQNIFRLYCQESLEKD